MGAFVNMPVTRWRLRAVSCLAPLLVVLLLVWPGSALGADAAEVSALVDRIQGLQEQANDLDVKAMDDLRMALAADPFDENAGDALRIIDRAGKNLSVVIQDMGEIAGLWSDISALDLVPSARTYAVQQYDIAEKNLEYYELSALLLDDYRTVYDREKLASLSRQDLKRLDEELAEVPKKMDRLDAELTRMEAASHEYFQANRVAWMQSQGVVWWRPVGSLIVASAFALLCGVLARRKNRSIAGWAVFGFFVPVIALIAILAVRKVELAPGDLPVRRPPLPPPEPLPSPPPASD